jgi:hypothetical protein
MNASPIPKPNVPRNWLFLFAGIAWLIAGGLLCGRALVWILADPLIPALTLASGGIGLAVLFYRTVFANVARKNISRICNLPERPCAFAFTAWRGYLMIGLMVSIGILLRGSSIPREMLAVSYMAMGGALIISAMTFSRKFWKISVQHQQCLNRRDL